MSETDLYAKIVSELSLPADVYEILRRPLMDLGFDVISHQDVFERRDRKPVAHYCAQAKGKSVALLHLSKETLSSANARAFILLLGDSFVEKVAGLFFFTQASDFSDIEYNKNIAKQWMNNSPGLCEAEFFKHEVIEHVRNLTEEERRQFIGDLLSVKRLLTSGPEPPPPVPGAEEPPEPEPLIGPEDAETIARILTRMALAAGVVDATDILTSIVDRVTLPLLLKSRMLKFSGDALLDARHLVKIAASLRRITEGDKFTVLGSLLRPLLELGELDPDDQRIIARIIYAKRLYLDDDELLSLMSRFRILEPPPAATPAPSEETAPEPKQEERKVIEQQYINALVRIMVKRATSVPNIAPAVYLRNVVETATLPDRVKSDMLNLTGSARIDAQNILKAAAGQGRNVSDEKSTVLGSLLESLLEPGEIDPDDQRVVAGIIYYNRLYLDPEELRSLMLRFRIPESAPAAAAVVAAAVDGVAKSGPAFTPHLPEDTKVLQGFLSKEPPALQDVGTMKAALKRTSAVCRVAIPGGRFGSGFLIAPGLVLTNYHVLNLEGRETEQQMKENAVQATLRFGFISAGKGQEEKGQVFRLKPDNPILASSPIDQLDFALLSVKDDIRDAEDIEPVEYSLDAPAIGTTLNMIQHPQGQVMKIALSGNGVTWKSDDARLIQYVTPAAEGSSGSPCFNDEWNLVAIHHAEETQRFLGIVAAGTVREGILFSRIYEQIKGHLA